MYHQLKQWQKKTGNKSEANLGAIGLGNARRAVMHRLYSFSSKTFEQFMYLGFLFLFYYLVTLNDIIDQIVQSTMNKQKR